jgi:hypothetical protein
VSCKSQKRRKKNKKEENDGDTSSAVINLNLGICFIIASLTVNNLYYNRSGALEEENCLSNSPKWYPAND